MICVIDFRDTFVTSPMLKYYKTEPGSRKMSNIYVDDAVREESTVERSLDKSGFVLLTDVFRILSLALC